MLDASYSQKHNKGKDNTDKDYNGNERVYLNINSDANMIKIGRIIRELLGFEVFRIAYTGSAILNT